MTTPDFVPVEGEKSIATVARLATTIWTEHFTPIIGAAQVDYMLERFQSAPAIARQLREGELSYRLVVADSEPVGYFAWRLENDALFLSKIYLLASRRGQGLARRVVEWLTELAREQGANSIWLTCNRGNSGTIAAYQRLGFVIEDEVRKDIGGGFVMDDYIMRLTI